MNCCLQITFKAGFTLLFSLTAREADNFGIFMRELLRTARDWMVSTLFILDVTQISLTSFCVLADAVIRTVGLYSVVSVVRLASSKMTWFCM